MERYGKCSICDEERNLMRWNPEVACYDCIAAIIAKTVELPVIPKCDFCDLPAEYDCKTKKDFWAYTCKRHYLLNGIGLGMGKGQKIIKVEHK